MKHALWPTDLAHRMKRGVIIVAAMAVAGLTSWLATDEFKQIVTDHPWFAIYVPVVTVILTQLAGHLAGKLKG